jgi:hypothetical protein
VSVGPSVAPVGPSVARSVAIAFQRSPRAALLFSAQSLGRAQTTDGETPQPAAPPPPPPRPRAPPPPGHGPSEAHRPGTVKLLSEGAVGKSTRSARRPRPLVTSQRQRHQSKANMPRFCNEADCQKTAHYGFPADEKFKRLKCQE